MGFNSAFKGLTWCLTTEGDSPYQQGCGNLFPLKLRSLLACKKKNV